MIVREATEEERQALGLSVFTANYDQWFAVLDCDGEIKGHICLSWALGQCFGHDTKHWGDDSRGAAMLWIAARKKARSLGFESVNVHVPMGDPIRQFWLDVGFEEKFILMRGEI